eukprot:gene7529-11853_t
MIKLVFFLVLLFHSSQSTPYINSILSWSSAPKFFYSQLYDVSSYTGINSDAVIGCIGDFDGDKYNDLFMIEGNNIHVYLWVRSQWKFGKLESATISNVERITNIVSNDFNYDGKLDLLVSSKQLDGNTKLSIFLQNDKQQLIESNYNITDATDQVSILDANGDFKTDLFGTNSLNNNISFWINEGAEKGFILQNITGFNYPLSKPNTPGFVDMNGDCFADLVVILCKNQKTENYCEESVMEIWLNQGGNKGFKKDLSIDLPKGSLTPTFGDLNRDGTNDIIIPICDPYPDCSKNNSILIYYNSQKRICTNVFDFIDCQSPTNLCVPQKYYLNATVLVDLPNRKFVFQQKNNLYFPPTIRLGDMFQDSFPALLSIFESKNNSEVSKRVEILQNVPCTEQACGADATARGLRTFSFYTHGSQALNDVKDPLNSFFIDLDETGTLDIITISKENIFTTFNNYFLDGFFFKILGLNGVSPGFFSKLFGANLPGTTSKITYADLDGTKYVQTSTQLSQSTYFSLQLPYTHYGIGRTAGYIEELFVGVPAGIYSLFQGVIPNSQLLVIPGSWILEMYVSISGTFVWVCVAFISTLIVLAVPIITFVIIEQLNDKKERTSKSSNLKSTPEKTGAKKSARGQTLVIVGLGLLGLAGSLYYTIPQRRVQKETKAEKEWVENYEKKLENPFDEKKVENIIKQENINVSMNEEEKNEPKIIVHSLQDEETEEQKKERKKQDDKEEEEKFKGTVYYDLMDKQITNLKERISVQINSIEKLVELKEKLTKENQQKDETIEKLENYQIDNEKEIHILIGRVQELEENLQQQIQNDLIELNEKLNLQKNELLEESNLKLSDLKNEYENIVKKLMDEMNDKISTEISKQKEVMDKKYFDKNLQRIQIFADLTSRVYGMETILDENLTYLKNSLELQKLMSSVLSLEEISKTNAPFKPELDLISKHSSKDKFVQVLVSKIPTEVSIVGVKTVDDLEVDFSNLKKEALSLSYAPDSSGLLGFIFSKIIGKIVIAEHGNVSGDSVDAKLSRTEFYLKHKNLSKAVEEIDSISGLSGEYLEDWLKESKKRLILQQTVSALNSHLLNTIQDIQ